MTVSVVIPLFNERDSIAPLYERLVMELPRLGRPCEIVFVDDGSTDGGSQKLDILARRDHRVKVIRFRRNYGQTAAMFAGLQMAAGDVIVTLDGDLQNDPADIPRMVRKLEEGYDLVHGWRKDRKDPWCSRRLPSQIANWLISKATRFPIRDLGCTLKAMRREIARELELYGEMHRFIPILARQRGARCVEMTVRHHPRQFGKTKYGLSRTVRVILDLLTVKYLLDYFASPMKLFGRLGICCGAVGGAAGLATAGMRLLHGAQITSNPLLLLAILSIMASLQFFSLGLLGEANARIYYSGQRGRSYAVRELINFERREDKPDQAGARAA